MKIVVFYRNLRIFVIKIVCFVVLLLLEKNTLDEALMEDDCTFSLGKQKGVR